MIHLQSLQVRPLPASRDFPFSVPLLWKLKELRFEAPVTLLVGENGTGKSTLLEGLACAADLAVVGSESTRRDPTLAQARELAK
jgi:predicted ATPase